MESIVGKVAVTAFIFAILGLLLIWIRVVEGGTPGERERIACGLMILIGAPTAIIATILYIWI